MRCPAGCAMPPTQPARLAQQAPGLAPTNQTQRHMTPTANQHQVGGEHYRHKAVQPWDYIHANGIGYLAGNVIKYVSRYQQKNGLQDLEKAAHYLQKLIEEERAAAEGQP